MSTLDARKNFAQVEVSTGYGDTDTSIVLASGEGSKLPDPSTDGAFNLVWWNATSYADPTNDPYREIVRCTARSTDTLTVTRGQEGTTAQNHNITGKTYVMALTLTAKMIDDIETALDGKVGTTDAVTLTNKRNQKRVYSTTSASSLTPEISTYDIFEFTALAENLTINNHSSSTPVNGEMMMFIIKDNGTSRTITWGSNYANGCATLPTATTVNKRTWILVQWNNTDGKWYCISVGTQS